MRRGSKSLQSIRPNVGELGSREPKLKTGWLNTLLASILSSNQWFSRMRVRFIAYKSKERAWADLEGSSADRRVVPALD
jgi:hypothetical protein